MFVRSAVASLIVALVAWVGAASPAAAGGKLSRARSESHGESRSHSSSSGGSRRSSSSSHSDSGRGVVLSPWNARRHHHHHDGGSSIFIDTYSEPAYGYGEGVAYAPEPPPLPPATYSSYPYAIKSSAYVIEPELQVASTSAGLDAHLRAERSTGQAFGGQLTLDAGFMSGVGQSNVGARILTPGRFELSARNAFLWEPAAHDYSIAGTVDLGYRFYQNSGVMFRFLLGAAYFGQFGYVEGGPHIGLGLDLFVGRPWVLSFEASTAVVGEVLMPQARVQLGYLFGRSEIFAGYQYMEVGSVGLSAPLLGTRIWL